jgi:putative DNA primase/helicase
VNSPVIYLCEGEADCLCALSHGLEAVTVTGGAGNWRDEFSPHFEGRDVAICYDADLTGYIGAHKVAARLVAVAAKVRILIWPDELIASEPVKDTKSHHKKTRAKALELVSEDRDELADSYIPRLPANHGQDVTDYLVNHGFGVGDLVKLLNNAEVIRAGGPDESGLEFPERFFRMGATGRWSFKHSLLAREILQENKLITDPASGLTYQWNW